MLDSVHRPSPPAGPPAMAHVDLVAPCPDLQIVRVESAPFAENSYVVFRPGGRGCFIVDPGFEPDSIINVIHERGLAPEAILLTHGHSDHIAGNEVLRDQWPRLPILIGRGDAGKLTDPAGNLSGAFGIALRSPPADTLLADEERIEVAGFAISVCEIPGHSSGHVVFRVEGCSPGVVFGGDVLFRESIGRTDFPDGDFAALAAGIRQHLYSLPDETIVFPGHGAETTVGHEKRHNPFVPGHAGAPRGAD
jgi:glyoxylase-like metal-dependent hydrolase (beta-lactamase superfamily II)